MSAPASVTRAGDPAGRAMRKLFQPSDDGNAVTAAAGSLARQAPSSAASSARVTTVKLI